MGYLVYGQPLDALEVFDRDWCSRCSGAAWNLTNYAERALRDKHGRDPDVAEVFRWIERHERRNAEREWLGVVIHEVDGRTSAQLRSALQASWDAEDDDG